MTSFPTAAIATALGADAGEPMVQTRGLVLFSDRDRPVFVPGVSARCQRAAVGFFCDGVRRRLAGLAALEWSRWVRGALPAIDLPLPLDWRQRFGVDLGGAALYCGSPGPLQKVTLRLPSLKDDQASTLVKLALHPRADAMIESEASCLQKLIAATPGIHRHVPSLLGRGQTAGGRRYLATRAAAGGIGPARLGLGQLQFLGALARAHGCRLGWSSGPAMSRTRQRLSRLDADAFPPGVREQLVASLAEVDAQLRDRPVSHTLAHGDFTRFNLRQRGSEFTVFDWEYAHAGANPLSDLLHYGLSKPGRINAAATLRAGMAQAVRLPAPLMDDGAPTDEDLSALALHFLADTLLFYASTDGRLEMRSYIVRRYLGLLAARSSWQAHPARRRAGRAQEGSA